MGSLFSYLTNLDLGHLPEDDSPIPEDDDIPGAYPTPSSPQLTPLPHTECLKKHAQESLNDLFKCTV